MSGGADRYGGVGRYGGEFTVGAAKKSASIHRSMVWCLTSSTEAGKGRGLTPAGLAHTFAVCLLEMAIMARGAKKVAEDTGKTGLPRFVDVKLTPEARSEFQSMSYTPQEIVAFLQGLCDDGYRVGCSWSGETQSYTVSLTCRDPKSANAGLCMTSFAGTLHMAVSLAVYKHTVYTGEKWLGDGESVAEMFG